MWEVYDARGGRRRAHLIGDVYINSTCQRLWQYYHAHYSASTRQGSIVRFFSG